MERSDVVVIGGGLTGSSICYYLAKAGAKVVLLEKGELCSEASASNQGGCPVLLTEPPVTELILEGHRIYRGGLEEELECDLEYEQTGALACTVNERVLPLLEEHAKRLERMGVRVRVMDRAELLSEADYLGEDIRGVAVECPDDFTVNPFRVVYGFASKARQLGARICDFTAATDIVRKDRRVKEVVLSDGERIETDYVVDAAGAWSSCIGKMVGLNVPICPVQGQVIATAPLPLSRFRYILDADWLSPTFDVAGSYVQERNGNWTIGASKQTVGYNKKVDPRIIRLLLERATQFLPFLQTAQIIRVWAGLRPSCYEDGLPILGTVEGCDGLIEATGILDGVKLAPIVGKLISELIVKGEASISLKPFSYGRFGK